MKKTIRLNESDLHKIVKESVKRILSESEDTLWAVWTVDSYGSLEFNAPKVLSLIKAKTKEDAERKAELRFLTRNWMTDPVASAHPATPEEIERWKKRNHVEYEKR